METDATHYSINILHSHGTGSLANSFNLLQLDGCDNQSESGGTDDTSL